MTEDILCFYPDDRAVAMLGNYNVVVNRTAAIRLRAVKILLADGSTEILLTNLFDQETFNSNQLANSARCDGLLKQILAKRKICFNWKTSAAIPLTQ